MVSNAAKTHRITAGRRVFAALDTTVLDLPLNHGGVFLGGPGCSPTGVAERHAVSVSPAVTSCGCAAPVGEQPGPPRARATHHVKVEAVPPPVKRPFDKGQPLPAIFRGTVRPLPRPCSSAVAAQAAGPSHRGPDNDRRSDPCRCIPPRPVGSRRRGGRRGSRR